VFYDSAEHVTFHVIKNYKNWEHNYLTKFPQYLIFLLVFLLVFTCVTSFSLRKMPSCGDILFGFPIPLWFCYRRSWKQQKNM